MESHNLYKHSRYQLAPGNSILSNSAYRSYKSRESSSRSYRVLPSSETIFLVTTLQGTEFIVNLAGHGSCSCMIYQEYQAPCSHAIACIRSCGLDPYSYFHLYYKWVTIQVT